MENPDVWYPFQRIICIERVANSTVMDDSKTENHRGKILLACTGSVASIKVPIIVDALLKLKVAEIVLYGLDYISTSADPEGGTGGPDSPPPLENHKLGFYRDNQGPPPPPGKS